MNDTSYIDKAKLQEINNEIVNLRKYNNELANNVRGDKLEGYINNLAKNINLLNNKIDQIYVDNTKNTE